MPHAVLNVILDSLSGSLSRPLTRRIMIMASLLALSPFPLRAHDPFQFNYACSVTQRNEKGLFRDVVNVVFLPEWQKKSHLYHDNEKDVWFEVVPVTNAMDEIEGYQMELRIHLPDQSTPLASFYGPEFSEIGFRHEGLNIGAHCFHVSQRGRAFYSPVLEKNK